MDKLSEEIDDLLKKKKKSIKDFENQDKMVNIMEGVEEAAKMTNSQVFGILNKKFDNLIGVTQDIKTNLPQNSWLRGHMGKIEKWAHGINDNSNQIREIMTQEEELGWLKAFSDRQIMSNISNSTSNSRTINITGASPNMVAESFRFNAGRPSRRAAI